MPKLPTKTFASFSKTPIEPPKLTAVQIDSYEWFKKTGLREIFDEFSPIKDYSSHNLELSFLDYYFGEPKYTEAEAQAKSITYSAPLRAKVKLAHAETGREKEQEVYLGEFPMMTDRGTFIINGVERVVISQLTRSPGVYFLAGESRGRKVFGSKIIPNRGAWLEFESDPDGTVWVKIDRHRKLAVTSLLRIFGLATDEEILKKLGEIIAPTLKKDSAHSVDESFFEIYKRLRPGDLARVEDAKRLVESMFNDPSRYDLGAVGRFKVNQRLDLKEESRLITLNDIVAIIKEIIKLNKDSHAQSDDIDHLGNRRIKAVGELLQMRVRIGFMRLRRHIQDRMAAGEFSDLEPAALTNSRLISSVVEEFFSSSQLSQFADQENPLSEIEHRRRLTVLGPGGLVRERAGIEVRDVHHSYYGRLCPIETPEGHNIGLVNHLTMYAKLDEHGFLITPYFEVKDGKVTESVKWLNAIEDERHKIASANTRLDKDGRILDEKVEARVKGEPALCDREECDLMEVAPNQLISLSTSLIPFLEHDDANRALMASNMQRQAIPSLVPEAPYVGTGAEDIAARGSGAVILAKRAGEVIELDAAHIVIKTADGEKDTYPLKKFRMSNQNTTITERPVVSKGDKVKKGDIIAENSSSDNGTLALGQNLVVAFMPFDGGNFEDAVVLSERVQMENRFTSIHIEDFITDVRDTKLGPELTTPDIPNVAESKLKNLDEEGIIRFGAEVRGGDILVGKISPKGESELLPEEKLLQAIFGEKARDVKDTSLSLPSGKSGRVVGVKILSRERGDKLDPGVISRIQVQVAELRNVQAGDKMAVRHGNKGVVSQIRPVEDMPHLADGTPVDIVLNPLGVPSRMNLGQILETHLGWAAKTLGYRAVTPTFAGAKEEMIKAELKTAGLPEDGQVTLYDGRTGEPFDRKVTVGVIYVMKLNHMVVDKVHMRSVGPYSLITQQPLRGKAQLGGQRFGEMEVWALEGHGAPHTLQEMLTIKSDDVPGRGAAYEAIIRGDEIKKPNVPASFNVLVSELKALGLAVTPLENGEKVDFGIEEKIGNLDFGSLKISIASPEEILNWSHGEVLKPETINYRTQRPEKDGLFSERIFGPTKDWECYCGKYKKVRYKGVVCDKCGVEVTRSVVRRERMGHITLATPVVHPWFLKSAPSKISLLLDESLPKLERVVYYAAHIVTSVNSEKRNEVLDEVKSELKRRKKEAGEKFDELKEETEKTIELLESLKPGMVIDEADLGRLKKFSHAFGVSSGGEGIREALMNFDWSAEEKVIEKELESVREANKKNKLLRRLALVKSIIRARIKPEWMVTTVLPVLPPDLRPMVALDGGRYATSDLNDLYRRVINRNNRLKKLLELKAPSVIVVNEKRMLQEAVDALVDSSVHLTASRPTAAARRPLRSLADMLKGKQGRFRQNLLGKRVDYSGRSVIVVGPHLRHDECGLPKRMALEIFRPFVIGQILDRGLAHNVKTANRLIEQEGPEVWEILEEVIADRKVLLNRAPTLHRLSVQAFKPILVEGLAIQIPPLVCTAFNADFDGDQMAVHLPLSREAQTEADQIMLSSHNFLSPASGESIVYPTKDMVLGCYYLTRVAEEAKGTGQKFNDKREAILAYENGYIALGALIKVGEMETTCGRIILNEVLPPDFGFINDRLDNSKLKKIVSDLTYRYDRETARKVIDGLKSLGFDYSTASGLSWGMADLVIPKEKKVILEEADARNNLVRDQYETGLLTESERYDKTIEIWTEAVLKIKKVVQGALEKGSSVYMMIDSGARGSWNQPVQMMGMKGLVVNPKGEEIELPVRTSLKEGHSNLSYFITTHGSRKGLADTALKTAEAGYLTRRLIDVAQDVVVREKDCRTKEGITLYRKDGEDFGQSFADRIFSRTALTDIKVGRRTVAKAGEVISRKAADEIQISDLKEVEVRSPITCKALYGICATCYGGDLGENRMVKVGTATGIIAAQSIGEPGTQLTLRTKHAGGVAGRDITTGLPRVEEIFEVHTPKGEAVLAPAAGQITKIEESGHLKTITLSTLKGKKAKAEEFSVPRDTALLIKEGDEVLAGDALTEGSINLRQLLELKGKEAAYRYIIREIQRIYVAEGNTINNKHLEIIVRQMFGRVKIVFPGDTEFTPGQVVDKSYFREVNKEMKAEGKEPAKAEEILLGTTKSALAANGWLSAASFQETSRVLTAAAAEGRIDSLRGLKENVIIGRLLPIGSQLEDESRMMDRIEERREASLVSGEEETGE